MEQNAASPVKNADITSALESWGMGSSSGAPSGMGGLGPGEGAGAGAGAARDRDRDRDDDAAVSSKMLMSTPQVRAWWT